MSFKAQKSELKADSSHFLTVVLEGALSDSEFILHHVTQSNMMSLYNIRAVLPIRLVAMVRDDHGTAFIHSLAVCPE